jgi:acyl-CoA reductase-like NAD-dependent aldehyde dehydrogenase
LGTSPTILHHLVTHPKIQAVGFTGSQKIGKLIMGMFDVLKRIKIPNAANFPFSPCGKPRNSNSGFR